MDNSDLQGLKFTDSMNTVLDFALASSSVFNQWEIDIIDVLLGLILEPNGVGGRVLRTLYIEHGPIEDLGRDVIVSHLEINKTVRPGSASGESFNRDASARLCHRVSNNR